MNSEIVALCRQSSDVSVRAACAPERLFAGVLKLFEIFLRIVISGPLHECFVTSGLSIIVLSPVG